MEAEASAANVAQEDASPPRWKELLSIRNIGAIYVWIAIIVFFALIASESFPTTQTAKSILNQFSISGLVALGSTGPVMKYSPVGAEAEPPATACISAAVTIVLAVA